MNNETTARARRRRRTALALAAATLLGGMALNRNSPAAIAAVAPSVRIDGTDVLQGRAMSPRWGDVLARLDSYEFVILNPAGGPEPVDGNDLGGTGYTPPNPDVEDFALRVEAKGKRALGFLPLTSVSRAGDYQRAGMDGVFTEGCPSAAEFGAITTSWPGAFVVAGASPCATNGLAGVVDPVNVEIASASSTGFSPNDGYPISNNPKLGVPAYFTDDAQWTRLLAAISDVGAIVVNGPDSDIDKIRPRIRAARSAGAKVYRYIETGYLTKGANLFPSRGAAALADPDLDGVFLDEVRSGCSVLAQSTYGGYWNSAVAAGKSLIYNPGQTMGRCFTTISTSAVNFEGTFASYQNWPASQWGRALPAAKQWQIIHGTPQNAIAQAAALAKARNAGLIWVAPTSDWNQLPNDSYLLELRVAIGGGIAPTTSTTVAATSSSTATTAATSTTSGSSSPTSAATTAATTTATTTATTVATTATTAAAASGSSGPPAAISSGATATASAAPSATTTAATTTAPAATAAPTTTAGLTTTASATTTSTTAVAPTTAPPTTAAAPATASARGASISKMTTKAKYVTKRVCVRSVRRRGRKVCTKYATVKVFVRAKKVTH